MWAFTPSFQASNQQADGCLAHSRPIEINARWIHDHVLRAIHSRKHDDRQVFRHPDATIVQSRHNCLKGILIVA